MGSQGASQRSATLERTAQHPGGGGGKTGLCAWPALPVSPLVSRHMSSHFRRSEGLGVWGAAEWRSREALRMYSSSGFRGCGSLSNRREPRVGCVLSQPFGCPSSTSPTGQHGGSEPSGMRPAPSYPDLTPASQISSRGGPAQLKLRRLTLDGVSDLWAAGVPL